MKLLIRIDYHVNTKHYLEVLSTFLKCNECQMDAKTIYSVLTKFLLAQDAIWTSNQYFFLNGDVKTALYAIRNHIYRRRMDVKTTLHVYWVFIAS